MCTRNVPLVLSCLFVMAGCSSGGVDSATNAKSSTSGAVSELEPGVAETAQNNTTGQSNSPVRISTSAEPTRPTKAAADGPSAAEGDESPVVGAASGRSEGNASGGSANLEEPKASGGSANLEEPKASGGSASLEEPKASGESGGSEPHDPDVLDTGADPKFSFFVTSYHHIKELSGTEKGFGGDLRYNGAATGLEGADALCQEMARRVGFGAKTWRAYLSTSNEDAIDRIGSGPWYDHAGQLVAQDKNGLVSQSRPAGGCCDTGVYDELGTFHDGKTDQDNDGKDDDDHDTMTATNADGTYSGFSCDDWTSVTAAAPGGFGLGSGLTLGHTWPAFSGRGWSQAHPASSCAAGVNFVQNGPGDGTHVGSGGGYGGFYCFAITP